METPEFEVVVGTYEEYLLGYKLTSSSDNIKFTQSFATHAHSGSIRCVCSLGKYLASGGADDRIIIYDMQTRKEHCWLNNHSATINCLKFTNNNTHLISGSADGVLSIVRVGSWLVEKFWDKAHKGLAILDIAIHPSGKLALTLGADCTLRTWNLIKGRHAYAINLTTKSTDAKSLSFIKWSSSGETFLLGGGLHLEIWSIESGGILNKYEFQSKVTSACWLNQKSVGIGHENGEITVLNTKTDKQKSISGHKMRVKSVENLENWLVSTSSDGHIKIWSFEKGSITEKGDCNTGCRCTSLTLVPTIKMKVEKLENSATSDVQMEENSDEDEQTNSKNMKQQNVKNKSRCKVIIEDESEKLLETRKRKYSNNNKDKNRINKKINEIGCKVVMEDESEKLLKKKKKLQKKKQNLQDSWSVENV